MDVLTTHNYKLGQIPSFNIPAILTCPDATKTCRNVCYATIRRFKMDIVQSALTLRYALSRQPGFDRLLIMQLQKLRPPFFRIHSSGDFYSLGYMRKWLRIIQACPHTLFVTYTRAWQDAKKLEYLKRMHKLKNCIIWLSADKETPRPPRGFPIAYMALDDADIPPYRCDLVFRVRRQPPRKWHFSGRKRQKTLVCPAEQGVKRKWHITCRRCLVCYDKARLQRIKERARHA